MQALLLNKSYCSNTVLRRDIILDESKKFNFKKGIGIKGEKIIETS